MLSAEPPVVVHPQSLPMQPIVVHVPCGTIDAYQSAWADKLDNADSLTYVEPDMDLLLVVHSSDDAVGTALIELQDGKEVQCDSSAVIVAHPAYSGYQFAHWSDGATYNPYTFAVLEDKLLTAVYVADGEPWQDTVVVYDTAYIFLHDTTYVTLYDTVSLMVHDTIDNYIHDTTTVYHTDTVYLHDTLFVHDTVFVGTDEVLTLDAKIYCRDGRVVVEGAEGGGVALYDVSGRLMAKRRDEGVPLCFDVPASGTYLVRIGHNAARRVVVIR